MNHASSKTRLGGAAALPAVRCLRATARWAADERQPQVLPVQGGPSALAAVDDAWFSDWENGGVVEMAGIYGGDVNQLGKFGI